MLSSPFRRLSTRQTTRPSFDASCSVCSMEGRHIHRHNSVLVTREDGSMGDLRDDIGGRNYDGIFEGFRGEANYEGKVVASNQTRSGLL